MHPRLVARYLPSHANMPVIRLPIAALLSPDLDDRHISYASHRILIALLHFTAVYYHHEFLYETFLEFGGIDTSSP